MKLLSATYEHTVIGFPKVKLKIHTEGDEITSAYIVVKDIIRRDAFKLTDNFGFEVHSVSGNSFKEALAKFEKWVRMRYSEDITVQG